MCLDLDLKGDERDFKLFKDHLLQLHTEVTANLSNSTFLPFLAASPSSRALVNAEGKDEEVGANTITSMDAFKSLSVLVDANAVSHHSSLNITTPHMLLQSSLLQPNSLLLSWKWLCNKQIDWLLVYLLGFRTGWLFELLIMKPDLLISWLADTPADLVTAVLTISFVPTDWLTDSLTHWLTHSLTDSLTGWLTDWYTDWLTDALIHWLTHWLTHWYTDTLTDSLTDTLTDWHTDWLTHWYTDWLTDWYSDSLTHWLTDSLTHSLTHWHTDSLTDWSQQLRPMLWLLHSCFDRLIVLSCIYCYAWICL